MFNIQFNFDPESSKITNLKVVKMDLSTDDPIVSVGDNKLILSKDAANLMQLVPGDRIAINY